MDRFTRIEPLEARIAPAIIVSPRMVTYQDGNGQTAVVKISKPLFTSVAAAENILQFDAGSFGSNSTEQNLTEINLLGNFGLTLHAAQDMNISVTVIPQVAGPNTVNVGSIVAASFGTDQVSQNIDLGKITIQGDLGYIDAGDNFSTPAIKSLNVLSMNEGEYSNVLGPIVSLHDAGDFGANLSILGSQFGSIGHLYIGGALTGNPSGGSVSGISAGLIEFTGHIGAATIGSMVGSTADGSGSLIGSSVNPSRIGSLHVLGNVTGSSGIESGAIFATSSIGKIVIDGNLVGGTAGASTSASATATPGYSGSINTQHVNSISIAGALIGGDQGAAVTSSSTDDTTGTVTQTTQPDPNLTASFSGAIVVGSAKSISIGSITGGSGVDSGLVQASGSLGKVSIGGSITGGTAGTGADASGSAGYSGAILGASATSISVAGALAGGSPSGDMVTVVTTPTSGSPTTTNTPAHTANASGVILVSSAKTLSIAGGIQGGGGYESGVVSTDPLALIFNGNDGAVTIHGDVAGGAGAGSGSFTAESVQSLHITGNLAGGSGANSGEISVSSNLRTLLIDKNINGGTADSTGAVIVGGSLTTAAIGGDLSASDSINSSSQVMESGYIEAGHIGAMKILGGVYSYANSGTGGIASSGAIRSDNEIASLEIGGSVTGVAASPVIISAVQGASTAKNPKTDLAIGTVSIDGSAQYLDILAGYSANTSTSALGTPVDGTAQIGTVAIGGNLSASNIVAGAQQGASGFFGNADNTDIAGPYNKAGLHSSIASIIVTGTAAGDGTMTGSFGFVAEELESINIDQTPVALQSNPQPISGNLYALEVS